MSKKAVHKKSIKKPVVVIQPSLDEAPKSKKSSLKSVKTKYLKHTLVEIIQKIMTERKLSIDEVSHLTGVHKITFRFILNNKANSVSIDRLIFVIDRLGFDIEFTTKFIEH